MSVRPILRWPDPRLSQHCAPVASVTPEIETLADDMLDTMYAAPGRGLAAPQIGVLLRLFVMDATWKTGPRTPQVLINPDITARSETKVVTGEGCLSIPGVTMDIARPDWVEVAWTERDGTRQSGRFEGFAAVCVQHELDHLDGVVTFDRLSPEARQTAEFAYAEAVR